MNERRTAKPVVWMGSSQKDLRAFPDDVQQTIGYALYLAQLGDRHDVEDHAGETYRAVYTVRIAGAIYVLHVFQKKAKRGIATPEPDMDLIKKRLRAAVDQAKASRP